MSPSAKTTLLAILAGIVAKASIAAGQDPANSTFPSELPYIGDLIEEAFPTWCIDEDEQRIYDVENCEDGSPNGRWSPLYFTKEFSGADPALGGYPTDIDVQYAFYYGAPFLGQACAGGPHHCSEDFDGENLNCAACPKVKTDEDNGPNGPGHIPPHIALAAVQRFYNDMAGDQDMDVADIYADAFDYEANACRILPDVLLRMIRTYFPRDPETGEAYYPPPFTELGGGYPLEFVNLVGETCEKEKAKHSEAGEMECFEQHSGDASLYPEYLELGHGSPHYCTKEGKEADVYNDWCPYIYFGPNRGKYRHPHVAFAAVETYLANLVMPDKCGTTWDDSNYPPEVDTTPAFPYMEDMTDIDAMAPTQPVINDGHFVWPGPAGTKKKPAKGKFNFDLYVTASDAIDGYCGLPSDKTCYALGWPTCCLASDSECPEEKPACDGQEPPEDDEPTSVPGASYCTYSPDPDCYLTGWPPCCSEGSLVECTEEKPPCEFDPPTEPSTDPPLTGTSYCTYAPDYDCYENGWPACCDGGADSCPEEKPVCEVACDTLVGMVCSVDDLSQLCSLIQRAGLVDALSTGSWTVFAPQNSAFERLNVGDWSKDRLRRLLLFHVVADEVLYSSDLKCVSPENLITMANGFDSRTLCRGGVPAFQKGRSNDSDDIPAIVLDDAVACNGVAHIIDEVLLYKEYD